MATVLSVDRLTNAANDIKTRIMFYDIIWSNIRTTKGGWIHQQMIKQLFQLKCSILLCQVLRGIIIIIVNVSMYMVYTVYIFIST